MGSAGGSANHPEPAVEFKYERGNRVRLKALQTFPMVVIATCNYHTLGYPGPHYVCSWFNTIGDISSDTFHEDLLELTGL